MWHSLEILNVLNTLTLQQIFWKKKPFSKNWSTVFSWKYYVWKCNIFIQNYYVRIQCSDKQNRVQNGPITKSGVLSVTALFFGEISFQFKSLLTKLIWCTNYPKLHIHTFRKRWSFIWAFFIPVATLKQHAIYIIPYL